MHLTWNYTHLVKVAATWSSESLSSCFCGFLLPDGLILHAGRWCSDCKCNCALTLSRLSPWIWITEKIILLSVLFFFFLLLLLNWKQRMLLLLSAPSLSPLSVRNWGFGGRVFLWSPWLPRCSLVALPQRLRPVLCSGRLRSPPKSSAVCWAAALPCLPYHEKAGADPEQSNPTAPGLSAAAGTLWITKEATRQCVPLSFDSFLKMSISRGRGVKSHQHWCRPISRRNCFKCSQRVFKWTFHYSNIIHTYIHTLFITLESSLGCLSDWPNIK